MHQIAKKGINMMLVFDEHQSYGLAAFENFCHSSYIVNISIPSHSFHIFLSLDSGCFGSLKVAYGRAIEDFIKVHITYIIKTKILIAFKATHFAAKTKKKFRRDFLESSLYSLDR